MTTRLISQIQVQEVYTHMVQESKVITISGRPGIGKTEVGYVCETSRRGCPIAPQVCAAVVIVVNICL